MFEHFTFGAASQAHTDCSGQSYSPFDISSTSTSYFAGEEFEVEVDMSNSSSSEKCEDRVSRDGVIGNVDGTIEGRRCVSGLEVDTELRAEDEDVDAIIQAFTNSTLRRDSYMAGYAYTSDYMSPNSSPELLSPTDELTAYNRNHSSVNRGSEALRVRNGRVGCKRRQRQLNTQMLMAGSMKQARDLSVLVRDMIVEGRQCDVRSVSPSPVSPVSTSSPTSSLKSPSHSEQSSESWSTPSVSEVHPDFTSTSQTQPLTLGYDEPSTQDYIPPESPDQDEGFHEPASDDESWTPSFLPTPHHYPSSYYQNLIYTTSRQLSQAYQSSPNHLNHDPNSYLSSNPDSVSQSGSRKMMGMGGLRWSRSKDVVLGLACGNGVALVKNRPRVRRRVRERREV